jgi:hypothetical protein
MPKTYIVEQGDDLYTIAGKFGFRDTKKIVAANGSLDRTAEVLNPGDVVSIPDLEPGAMSAKEKQTTRFRLTTPLRSVKLPLKDDEGNAISGKDYELILGDVHLKGTTGGDGVVAAEVAWRERYASLLIDKPSSGA